MRPKHLIVIGFAALAASAQAQSGGLSNAARYLAAQEAAKGCNGGAGELGSGGIIKRDLTGDGRADLIIDHKAMTCPPGGGLCDFSGAAGCAVKLFVREGALLQPEIDLL